MRLDLYAEIVAGYTFRKAIEPDKSGSISVLQAKDIESGIIIYNADGLVRTSLKVPFGASYLRTNDVLLTSRGSGIGSFRSTVFKGGENDIMASSSVHIIRVKDAKVLPEYISHYLNSLQGQTQLLQIVSGSYIQTIPRKRLEDLEIPIPSLVVQRGIVDLQENIKQQEKIQARKKQLKQNLINATFKNLITK